MIARSGEQRERIEFPADEEWLEAPGMPEILISSHGRVYNTNTYRLLPPVCSPSSQGRPRVFVYGRSRPTTLTLALEVLRAFGDPEPARRGVAAFRDGDVTNCRIDNLYWVTIHTAEHAAAREAERAFVAAKAGQPKRLAPVPKVSADGSEGGTVEDARARRAARIATRPPLARCAELDRERGRKIRRWAAANGVKVAPRGKVPRAVEERYVREVESPVEASA